MSLHTSTTKSKFVGWAIIALMAACIFYFEVYKIYTGAAKMTTVTAFMFMLLCIVAGEVISTRTKAFMPSMFVTAVFFVLGFWTFFPKDILQLGGIAPTLPAMVVMMMVVHLGTMLNIQELIDQWKTVLVTLAGMVGILLVVLTVGSFVLGQETAAVAAPPLTGGLVAALMMQEAAGSNQHLAILAMAVYVMQGFVGYPLTSYCLKKEGRSILKQYHEGTLVLADAKDASVEGQAAAKKYSWDVFPQIPTRYKSDFTHLLIILVLLVVSSYMEMLTGGIISKFVWALILGVFASAMGFIDHHVLVKSRSMGLIYTIILMYVFAQLSSITPETLIILLKDFAILITLSTVGIALIAIPVGRVLGWSVPLSFAIGLGSLAGGFPASYALSVEAAKVVAQNKEEQELVEGIILPKTLVAGFVSATSGSVLIAGFVLAIFFAK